MKCCELKMAVVVAAALGTGLAGCSRKPAAAPPAAAPVPAVTVAKPEVRKITEWDEFTGRLASPETVELRARVSGYLEKIHFKEGTEVKAGDMLFTIDPRPYTAVAERARAELERARTREELASGEAVNAEELLKTRAISNEENQRRAKALAEAHGAVKSAEAALSGAELDLEFTKVTAPIGGRISNAKITPGNLVTGGTKDATLLTTIVSLDPLWCWIEVDERSALKYRELHRTGQRVSALFSEIPAQMGLADQAGFPHAGHMDFVDNQLNPATGSIRGRAVFPNADRLMAPGFFARVRIPGSGEYEGMLVKDSAVGSDQGRPFVWVVEAGEKAAMRPVTLGPLVDGLRVVRTGLKAEDRVIVNGQMAVRAGAQVKAGG